MVPQAKLLLDSVTGSGSATNGGTFTSANIDTFEVEKLVSIDIAATTQSASTQAGSPSLLKLQESDTTVASTFVDVVGFRGGSAAATVVDFVIGIGKTAGSNSYKMNVNVAGSARKRYLNVVASPTTSQTFIVTANGFGLRQTPNTPAKAGVLNLVEG
jgi:hypothetical protein